MVVTQLRARWLREMGYRPLSLRRPLADGDAMGDSLATPMIAKPAAAEIVVAAQEISPSHDDALWMALLQACDAQPADAAVLGWKRSDEACAFAFVGAELHLNLGLLRRQPEAKRALWRTLRALRRQRRGAR